MNKNKKRFVFFSILPFLLSSCVGQVTNNVDSKIDAKVDSQVTAKANLNTNVNANLEPRDVKTNIEKSKEKKPVSVVVLPSDITINVGDEIKLLGTVKYSDESIDNNILYFSSNNSLSKLNQDSGILNALGEGKIQITASSKLDASINTTINITIINKKNSSIVIVIPQSKIISDDKKIKERAELKGNVFDTSGIPVEGAIVNAKAIDEGVTWEAETQTGVGGSYIFKAPLEGAPVGARIEITVTKDGWTTRTRSEVLKSNINGDPKANIFDFGNGNGANTPDYSIQDEPEVTMLKINGRKAYNSDGASTGNAGLTPAPNPRKPDLLIPALQGLSSDSLTVEMTFSEPVRKDDVENYFIITSQSNLIIDKNFASSTFTWGTNDSSVVFKINKAILSDYNGAETKYMLDFTNPFRDKTGKYSKSRRTFRFTPSAINDFHVFSLINQK